MSLAEFDRLPEVERDLWVADWEREQATCRDCGNPREQCSDHKRPWYSYRRVCYATMEREAAQAAYEALHEKQPWHDGTFTSWAKERSASHPYRYDAGVSIGATETDLTPWDLFTTKADASPVQPPRQD